MKQTFITCLILLSSLVAMQVVAQTDVTVVYCDGGQETLTVQDEGGLYFADDNLSISTTIGNTRKFALSNIQKLLFSAQSVGFQNVAATGDMMIYPNPVSDKLNIINAESESLQFVIFSVSGAILLEGNVAADQSIDVSSLAAGFYILNVNGQTLRFSKS